MNGNLFTHVAPKSSQEQVYTRTRSNWKLEMLAFEERGKPQYPEKNPRINSKERTNNKLNPHINSGSRSQATWVGGERCHHSTIPAPKHKKKN